MSVVFTHFTRVVIASAKVATERHCCCFEGGICATLSCDAISASKSKCGWSGFSGEAEGCASPCFGQNGVYTVRDYCAVCESCGGLVHSGYATFPPLRRWLSLTQACGACSSNVTWDPDTCVQTGEVGTCSGIECHDCATFTASDEYTTERLIENAIEALPEYADTFAEQCYSYYHLSQYEETITIRRFKPKFSVFSPFFTDLTITYNEHTVLDSDPDHPTDTPRTLTLPAGESEVIGEEVFEPSENGQVTITDIVDCLCPTFRNVNATFSGVGDCGCGAIGDGSYKVDPSVFNQEYPLVRTVEGGIMQWESAWPMAFPGVYQRYNHVPDALLASCEAARSACIAGCGDGACIAACNAAMDGCLDCNYTGNSDELRSCNCYELDTTCKCGAHMVVQCNPPNEAFPRARSSVLVVVANSYCGPPEEIDCRMACSETYLACYAACDEFDFACPNVCFNEASECSGICGESGCGDSFSWQGRFGWAGDWQDLFGTSLDNIYGCGGSVVLAENPAP